MENKKQQPIEKVLSDYVVENANLKIMIAELQAELAKRHTEEDDDVKPIQNN